MLRTELRAGRKGMKSRYLLVVGVCLALGVFDGEAAQRYVNLFNASPQPPYSAWGTAATNIQDAIDASSAGDVILVTNGLYQTGGRTVNGFVLTNRVVVDKAVTVQSVNGPGVTLIGGYQVPGSTNGASAVRCVYMTNGAALIGFTMTNGATIIGPGDELHEASGGGVWCEDVSATVSNCVLAANGADFHYGVGGGAVGGTFDQSTFVGNWANAGGGAYNGILQNCTLTNNSAVGPGGGAFGGTLSNCLLTGNSAATGGGALGGTLNYCVVTRNSATDGGGAGGTLNNCVISNNTAANTGGGTYYTSATNCIITGNTAGSGGGTYNGSLNGCSISNNTAVYQGGGSHSSTLIRSVLAGNWAELGGGAYAGTLNNCILSNNLALYTGGGANLATLNGCALIANSTPAMGGGAAGSSLDNCTLAGNSAAVGGGVYSCAVTNSIVYYNLASSGQNCQGGNLDHVCTTPLPAIGDGNIADEPKFADLYHLSAGSPCRGAGDFASASGLDIDGEPWANPPSMGCDEFYPQVGANPLNVAIQALFTNLATGFTGSFTAQIIGHASSNLWDFGDGAQATNLPYAAHAWTSPGVYAVSVWAFNDTNPGGVEATIVVNVVAQPVQYVALGSPTPAAPYLSWATAATNIQDAVDAAYGGGLILVSNGVYQTGGRPAAGQFLTNRLIVTRPVTVASVNGPAVTTIKAGPVPNSIEARCASLSDGAKLSGFTLANGASRSLISNYRNPDGSGGGLWCQSTNVIVSNCVIVSNWCAVYGGGVYAGTLSGCQINCNATAAGSPSGGAAAYSVVSDSTINSNTSPNCGGALSCVLSNCSLSGNSQGGAAGCSIYGCSIEGNTGYFGGGVAGSDVHNSTIRGNHANSGGGAYDSTLNDCTISNNTATSSGGGVYNDAQPPDLGQNNRLYGNTAGGSGGGLYLTASRNLVNWTFVTNSSAGDGGGMYYSAGISAPVDGCSFTGNHSGGKGGGLYTSSSFLLVSNSSFSSNIADGNGGGAYNATIVNCSFTGNRAVNGGGVFGTISNCVFNSNIATGNGGGAYSPGLSPNCSFTNNSAANGGGSYGGIFSNSVFAGNSAQTNGGATYGAALMNCLVVSNQAAFGGGAFGGATYPNTQFAYLGCKVIGNVARADGGGINFSPTGISGTNCLVQGNSASNNGGGIFVGTLSGSRVAGNSAGANGGGGYNATLSLSIISSNTAGANGGGTYTSTLKNVLVNGNVAVNGGGTYGGTLNNSTIVNNQATVAGGGIYFPSGGTVSSCIVYDNSAPAGMNYSGSFSISTCCTTPLPPVGTQNLTNDPSFVSLAAGNFRLQTNSPCINAGSAPVGPPGVDLDGRPRIVGVRIDIGAYEFQGPGMGEFISWLQQYGLSTSGSADYADTDGDGMNNWQEWIAGTDPIDALSVLKMLTPARSNDGNSLLVSWQSVTNRTYFVQRGDSLSTQPVFTTIRTNIIGQPGTMTYADTNSIGSVPLFYRVGIQ